MEWLNYHHLLYFWTAVHEGGVSRAAEKLRLAQPTVSAQIRQLEVVIGEKLLERQGRRLVLTDVGRLVYRYADEIFGMGRELLDALRDRTAGGRLLTLAVGVANALPKLVVHRLLAPVLSGQTAMRLVCREDGLEVLTTELTMHALDVVISDAPAPTQVRGKVFNHLLGESDTTFFAAAPLAGKLRRRFPASLDGVPLLLPTPATALRRALDQWFDAEGLNPRIVGEFDDSALMKTFGQDGGAAFPGPTAAAREIARQYRVQAIGRTPAVRERYYAISAERRLKHPGVLAITTAARTEVFAP
ncbi:MAG: transcriptional activator NhaR [Vicinamibacterales bacterium]